MRDDRLLLEDILERISLTEEFIESGRQAFFASRLIQEGVIRNLEIIGEAAANLSDELRDKHPQIPWAQIVAFRNYVIHVYWSIRMDRVWEIIENDLRPLKEHVLTMLQELDGLEEGE